MPAAVEVEDLHKSYRAKRGEPVHALNGVSFEVPAGRIHGLLGPNGAGKSTLVKLLSTISTPTSGRASVLGHDVVRDPLGARRQMAVVLQQAAAENLLNVRDNLAIYAALHGVPRELARRRIAAIVEEFELGDKLKTTVQELSLGTKRRIQVAKIFLLDAPLIVLDEATTGMDPLMRRRVLDRLRAEARQGRTILLTTQVLSEAEELCETIMILDRGRAMASGTLAELRRRATQTFRVSLVLAKPSPEAVALLGTLGAAELRVDGAIAELSFHGEESSLLAKLAELSRSVPIAQFEVRGPSLEEIFVSLVEEAR